MIYNGRDFSEFGVHVDESKAFGSPEKDYEMIEVVGRNGNLSIYNDRFKDIVLSFPCFIRSGFIEKYRNLLAYLNSLNGYQRLETEKEPNHFRKALFTGSVEVQTTPWNQGGFFTINFSALPQRFLKSGETTTSVSSSSSSVSGNPVSISNPSGLTSLTGLSVDIQPVQSGEGDPSPTNIRPITGHSSATVTRTGFNQWDEQWEVGYYGSTGRPSDTSGYIRSKNFIPVTPNDTYYCHTGTASNFCLQFYGRDKAFISQSYNYRDTTVTIPSNAYYVRFWRNENAYNNDISINYPSTITDYHAYTGNTYPISLGQTVYGGSVDLATGVLTVDRVAKTINGGMSLNSNWSNAQTTVVSGNILSPVADSTKISTAISSALPNATEYGISTAVGGNAITTPCFGLNATQANAGFIYLRLPSSVGTTADAVNTWLSNNPITVVYPLKEPQTVQLTAQQVSLLTGTNVISTDMSSLTVTISSPAELENPTLFESKPIIRVYGNGTLNINDQYITVVNSPYTYIDIDCELMDCYHGSNNANQYVSFSTTDYVTLRSGMNYFSYSGFTKVEVTPRWYEI